MAVVSDCNNIKKMEKEIILTEKDKQEIAEIPKGII